MIYTISIITLINKETNIQSDFSFPPFDYGRMEDGRRRAFKNLLSTIYKYLHFSWNIKDRNVWQKQSLVSCGSGMVEVFFLQYFHAKRDSWKLRIFKKG